MARVECREIFESDCGDEGRDMEDTIDTQADKAVGGLT